MWTKQEKLTYKVSVDQLLKRIEVYVKTNFDHYQDVVCILDKLQDPLLDNNLQAIKDAPINEETKDKAEYGDEFEKVLLNDTVNRYLNRLTVVNLSVRKIFELL